MIIKRQGLITIVLPVLFFLGFFLFLIWPAQKRYNLSQAEYNQKKAALRTFLSRPGGPPSAGEINVLNNEIKMLEEVYKDIQKKMLKDFQDLPALGPVEFGDILHRTKKELQREAEQAGCKIPLDLGFKETIPTVEEVKIMAKELSAVENLIKEALQLKVGNIDNFKPLGLSRDGHWEKVSMELTLRAEFEKVVEFLYHLSQGEKVYLVRALALKRGEMAAAITPRLKAAGPVTKSEESKETKTVSSWPLTATILVDYCLYKADHGN